jgi:multidrug efflux pump
MGACTRLSEKGFSSLLSGYSNSLRWVLDHPGPVLIILLLTIGLNFYLIDIIPKGFFPQQDTGAIVGGVVGPQDASFAVMDNSVRALVGVIKADPAVAHVNAYTGHGHRTAASFTSRSSLSMSARLARRNHQSPAAQDEPAPRSPSLPAGGAGSAHRGKVERRPLSIHYPVG